MSYQYLDLDVDDGVGWYRFHREPVNAVDWAMLDELEPALNTLLDDPSVRVIVIGTAIERYFGTGADISAFRGQAHRMHEWVTKTHAIASLLRASKKPILAAISGVAVGGGLEMTFHADLRFAADTARIGQPEVNIGFIPPVGGTQGLVRLVGRSNAFKLLYGGELIDAQTAHAMGLVDFVVSHESLDIEVQRYAQRLASKPANAIASIRRCLVEGGGNTFSGGMEIEREEAIRLALNPNFEEGVNAFLEKREPTWSDSLE